MIRNYTSHLLLLGALLVVQNISLAQNEFFLSPGFGVSYSKARLSKLQASYDSYQTYLDQNFATDPYTADPNWNLTNIIPTLSLQAGLKMDKVMYGAAYIPHFMKQERVVRRESGYGRRFSWREQRHDILIDLGWSGEKVDVYGSVGANMVNFKMVSSTIYPSGLESVTNEFDFNGVFRLFDAGYSLGAGIRVKPLSFLALDLRYIYSSDLLPGEKNSVIDDETALSDDSFARTPGTSQYPQDYTQPLSLDNEINPDFRRSYVQLTLHYFWRYGK
jgi:hypothetical protein